MGGFLLGRDVNVVSCQFSHKEPKAKSKKEEREVGWFVSAVGPLFRLGMYVYVQRWYAQLDGGTGRGRLPRCIRAICSRQETSSGRLTGLQCMA